MSKESAMLVFDSTVWYLNAAALQDACGEAGNALSYRVRMNRGERSTISNAEYGAVYSREAPGRCGSVT
jgi:hypothetical protein